MRKAEFKGAVEKPRLVNDSRFGIRKLFKTDKETPSIGIYATPGRGPNGEHQN